MTYLNVSSLLSGWWLGIMTCFLSDVKMYVWNTSNKFFSWYSLPLKFTAKCEIVCFFFCVENCYVFPLWCIRVKCFPNGDGFMWNIFKYVFLDTIARCPKSSYKKLQLFCCLFEHFVLNIRKTIVNEFFKNCVWIWCKPNFYNNL